MQARWSRKFVGSSNPVTIDPVNAKPRVSRVGKSVSHSGVQTRRIARTTPATLSNGTAVRPKTIGPLSLRTVSHAEPRLDTGRVGVEGHGAAAVRHEEPARVSIDGPPDLSIRK